MPDTGSPALPERTRQIAALMARHFDLVTDDLGGNLIADEVIDSADFMDLFSLLEAEFDIAIQQEDLTLDNFSSCAAIAAFTLAKRAPGP